MKIKVFVGIIGVVFMLFVSQFWVVILKLSYNQDKFYFVYKVMEFFVKKSKEYFNGDIIICIYLNGILGI